MIICLKQDIARSQDPFQKGKSCICTEGKQLSLGENFLNSSIHLIVCEFMRNLPLIPHKAKGFVTALQSESITKWTWACPLLCCLVEGMHSLSIAQSPREQH